MTEQETIEYIKCKNDIVYFAENYCEINTIDKGETLIKLYDFQKQLLKELISNDKILIHHSRQLGISKIISIFLAWKNIFTNDYYSYYCKNFNVCRSMRQETIKHMSKYKCNRLVTFDSNFERLYGSENAVIELMSPKDLPISINTKSALIFTNIVDENMLQQLNKFKYIKLDWSVHPYRDLEWRNKMMNEMGIDLFKQQFLD